MVHFFNIEIGTLWVFNIEIRTLCTPGVLVVYPWCTPGVLLVYSWCTPPTPRVLLVYSWCTRGVLLVYSSHSWCTPGVLLVYSDPGVLLVYSWCTPGVHNHIGSRWSLEPATFRFLDQGASLLAIRLLWWTHGVLLVYSSHSWCTPGVLLVYSWCTHVVLMVYSDPGVLLVYSWCTGGVPLVYSWYTPGVLLVYLWWTWLRVGLAPRSKNFTKCSCHIWGHIPKLMMTLKKLASPLNYKLEPVFLVLVFLVYMTLTS